MTSITDLTAHLADMLFASEYEDAGITHEQLTDSVRENREHRIEEYGPHVDGADERLDELARAVWADLTDGAEYPF